MENLANLSLEERDYVERKVENDSKNPVIAWLLWVFLGGLGAHRFYFGKTGSAVAILLITIFLSWLTFGIITIVWVLIDAFSINKWTRQDKEKVREDAIRTVLLMRNKA